MTIASLPMYDADRSAVENWWQGLAEHLRRQGVATPPIALHWPDDLSRHWQDPALLLSQACGYPLMHALKGSVQLVGTLAYDAAGCEGIRYTSHLMVREGDPSLELADFRGRVIAYNSVDSQSGYHALRALTAPLARQGRFFSQSRASGSHRASLLMLQEEHADLAAIDCITLMGLASTTPSLLRGLRRIGSTTPVPGLPLITSAATSPVTLRALREAIQQAVSDPALSTVRAALGIVGFEITSRRDYQVIADLAIAADTLGHHAL